MPRALISLSVLILTLAVAIVPGRTASAAGETRGNDPALESLLRAQVPADLGTFGVAVKDLSSGRTAYVNPDEVFEAASLYKLFVMVELFRQQRAGRLSLDREPWLRSSLEAMITWSDNDAALALYSRVGIPSINATMRALGLPQSQVAWVSTSTPREMGQLLERIALLRAVDPASSAEMIRVMGRQQVNDRLPMGLPPGTYVAHKTGDLGAMTHDAGIVYAPRGPMVIVAMNKGSYNVYLSRQVEAALARVAYAYVQEAMPPERPDPPLLFDPSLDEALRNSVPAGYGVAVKHLRTGQGALLNVEGYWPGGEPLGPWPGTARGTLLWLQWLGLEPPPKHDGGWQGLDSVPGVPEATSLAGGVPRDVRLAHRFSFDGYSASDAGLVFAPSGSYAVAVVARGTGGDDIAAISRQLYAYFADGTWWQPTVPADVQAGPPALADGEVEQPNGEPHEPGAGSQPAT